MGCGVSLITVVSFNKDCFNIEQGTRNIEQGTGNIEQGTRNIEQRTAEGVKKIWNI